MNEEQELRLRLYGIIGDLMIAAERLLVQLNVDENASGGLLSRETHRLAGELRVAMTAGLPSEPTE